MMNLSIYRDDGNSRNREFYADPDRKPVVPPPNLQLIPDRLQHERRWVGWTLEWREGGREGGLWTKVPYQPNGRHAKSNDPSTWATFEEVAKAYERGGFDGIGFMLGDGFIGVDFDDVRDPDTRKFTKTAAAIGRRLGTYAEVSPSGTGAKLIGRGVWHADWHRKPLPDGGEIEVYDSGRYFTITGCRIGGVAEVADIQTALDELAAQFGDKPAPEEPPGGDALAPPPDDDDELICRAMGAKNCEKFAHLWHGHKSGYPSESEADLALCGMLAFWTGGDANRIDRLFRKSKLVRAKWDETRGDRTYGQRTVAKALAGKTEYYTPKSADPSANTSAAAHLVQIGRKYDLWHDPTGRAFATAGRQSFSIRGRDFRFLLIDEYWERTGGKVPGSNALGNAINAIEATAVRRRPEYPAHVRVAGHDGRTYLHLADGESTVIETDTDGWRVCESPPVRFRKSPGMLPLPMPSAGGSLAELRHFLNVPDDGTFALVKGWLAGAFRPDGPFPLMVLLGEQGSAKTTTARVLKRLLDPSEAGLRSEPKEVRDMMIAANNGWVVAYDNLSYLPPRLSDALCRLATGGGFGTRQLYTDEDEVIFEAKRPVVLNGIEDFVTRGDLLERSILIRHPPIPEDRRRPESEFWAEFDAAHPKLLGSLLDYVVAGLRALPQVNLDRLPRMADFARFAVACERGAGEQPLFLSAYAENQAGAHEQALDASPVTAALVEHMDGRDEWEGTATRLLKDLARTLPTRGDGLTPVCPHGWPKGPNALTNCLRRLGPNLRRVHRLEVDCDGRTSRGRVVRISRPPDNPRDRPAPGTAEQRDPPDDEGCEFEVPDL